MNHGPRFKLKIEVSKEWLQQPAGPVKCWSHWKFLEMLAWRRAWYESLVGCKPWLSSWQPLIQDSAPGPGWAGKIVVEP